MRFGRECAIPPKKTRFRRAPTTAPTTGRDPWGDARTKRRGARALDAPARTRSAARTWRGACPPSSRPSPRRRGAWPASKLTRQSSPRSREGGRHPRRSCETASTCRQTHTHKNGQNLTSYRRSGERDRDGQCRRALRGLGAQAHARLHAAGAASRGAIGATRAEKRRRKDITARAHPSRALTALMISARPGEARTNALVNPATTPNIIPSLLFSCARVGCERDHPRQSRSRKDDAEREWSEHAVEPWRAELCTWQVRADVLERSQALGLAEVQAGRIVDEVARERAHEQCEQRSDLVRILLGAVGTRALPLQGVAHTSRARGRIGAARAREWSGGARGLAWRGGAHSHPFYDRPAELRSKIEAGRPT